MRRSVICLLKRRARALCELPGVGEKIANCVLLFAYERLDAVPIDVWIGRVLNEVYFAGRIQSPVARVKIIFGELFRHLCWLCTTILVSSLAIDVPKKGMIQVALCPSEIRRISATDLSGVTAVVFDVLRATSSMITGLASGVEAIIPVRTVAEARKLKLRRSGSSFGRRTRRITPGGFRSWQFTGRI